MSKTEKPIIILNQMILLPVASGGIKIRSNPPKSASSVLLFLSRYTGGAKAQSL